MQYGIFRCPILLVEDDINFRNSFESLLFSSKFGQIEITSNGEKVIEYLKVKKKDRHLGPDFINFNFVMAIINGLLLRWLSKLKNYPVRMLSFPIISGGTSRENC